MSDFTFWDYAVVLAVSFGVAFLVVAGVTHWQSMNRDGDR